MGWNLSNVWIGVEVSKEAQKTLTHLSQDIKKIFDTNSLDFKNPSIHHMTLWYFRNITERRLVDILSSLEQLKKKHKHIQLINPWISYDETLHKIDHRKSNINNNLYFVLKPHNPDSVYLQFIQSQHISPHISLWSTTDDISDIESTLKKIKDTRDIYIKNTPITVDLSKIHIKF